MPYNIASLCYTAGLILYEVKIAVDLVRLTFIENSIQGGYRQTDIPHPKKISIKNQIIENDVAI